MADTVDGEPRLTSSVGIGEAARRIGLAPSALRFYERQGLVEPGRGQDGRRRYGPEDLRRLAFVAMGRDLGFDVAALRRALRPGPAGWAVIVDDQIARLDARIARAQRARAALASARDCPAPEPVLDCPYLRAELDALVGH